MRAARVTAFGGADRLELFEGPTPEPGPGEVRLRVRAAALNVADLLQREGRYLGGPRPPFVPGLEAAGEVEALGPGVTSLAVGQRVTALTRGGLLASAACLPAKACHPTAPGLSDVEAAALPVASLTAALALVEVARARPGERLLVHAAAGGVGSAAVQVGRALDLEVIAAASTAAKRERALALGAQQALAYEQVSDALRAPGARPDLVLDGAGGAPLQRALRVLAPLGRAVVLGWWTPEPPPLDTTRLTYRSQGVLGCHLDALRARPDLAAALQRRIDAWVGAGALRPVVGEVLPLARAAAAYARLEDRARWGKIVIDCS